MGKPSYFITATFKTAGASRRNAKSVERAMRAWLAQLRKLYPKLMWVKVTEWTKKRQAHLHLIVGGIPKIKDKCFEVRNREVGKELRKECQLPEECLNHVTSRLWLKATRDSYITYCMDVVGSKGIASYMSKYVTKEMISWSGMESVGFKRRWSCSRNFPRYEKLELFGTQAKSWVVHGWMPEGRIDPSYLEMMGEPPSDGAFQRVGTETAKRMAREKEVKNLKGMIGRVYASNNEAIYAAPGGGEHR